MNNTPYTPVFILSCERSGSTMLRYIMDTHSKITCPGHLYLGDLCSSLNRTLTGTLAQTHTELDEEGKKNFAINETRKIIDNIMSRYTKAKDKQIWCEKTPMNLDYLPVLEAHFPDAKYICLYRNCLDVVHSSVNLSKYRFLPEHVPYVHRNPESIIAAMVENWLEKTDRLLAFEAAHQERCFRVKYESVVMRSEETLSSLFEFLEVGWEKDLMGRVFEVSHDQGEGDGRAALSSKIRQDSVGKGIEVPRAGIPKKFITEIDRLLGKLEYACLDDYYSNNTGFIRNEINENPMSNISDIFKNHFMNAIKNNRGRYPALQGIWKIIIKGDTDRAWLIDLSNQGGLVTEGDSKADSTLCLSAALLLEMVNGTRDAIEAFAQGEIDVEGVSDQNSLMDLGKLLFS
ncbi:sulfotransferase [Methylobacter sp. Wu8]|uniref:SCP-2 sterol transfer family protein n=1 Tax=Methylobacter tundripaludum TaxID=173365 RepID=A0A2S6GPZ3_9GAMM|nr:sulfotransferase [Methylobacter tundripaludum]MCK9636876.1 sulfotransferase [Methylobacter tundripaludum]PPK67335.1 SCP-2 sterol transfer family protein [Methylobacter tundripaludum]